MDSVPGTAFQYYVLASRHFLCDFGGILESVHALLFSHFNSFASGVNFPTVYNDTMVVKGLSTAYILTFD